MYILPVITFIVVNWCLYKIKLAMSTHFLERPGSLVAPQRGGRRKIRVSADILTGSGSGGDTTADGEESSGESHLSDTDMMSPDDEADLDALLSPDLDTPDEMEDSIMERKFLF